MERHGTGRGGGGGEKRERRGARERQFFSCLFISIHVFKFPNYLFTFPAARARRGREAKRRIFALFSRGCKSKERKEERKEETKQRKK